MPGAVSAETLSTQCLKHNLAITLITLPFRYVLFYVFHLFLNFMLAVL